MIIGFDASRAFVLQKTGTENYSFQLLANLAKIDRQNQYRVYVRKNSSQIQNQQRWPANFKFQEINFPRFWTQIGLAREVFFHPPDILFIPAHTLPIIRPANLKTVVTIHDLGAEFLPAFHTFPQKFYLTFSTKYAVKNATSLIAVSSATKKDLIEKYEAIPDKIFVIHEGIEINRFKIKNSKSKISTILKKYQIKRPYLLFVGTVQPRKNLERLIKAFSLLVHSFKLKLKNKKYSDLNLIVVGKLGWGYDQILSAPKKFGVSNQVRFLNYVTDYDLPTIYQQASVFVLPSLVEGFGLPILEAMAASCPVACSKSSSLPEVAGTAAVYFNPQSSDQIASAIFQVLTNPKLKKQLIDKGRLQVSKFSWEKTAQKTLTVFKKIHLS